MHGELDEAPRAAQLVVEVASSLQQRLGEISGSMRDLLATRITELDGDAAIVELLYASIEGNVENILNSVRLGIGVDNIEPPSAAYEYARRLAQRGVPVSALVRGYRLGQQHLLEQVFAECERREPDRAVRADAYRDLVSVTFDYIDWISQGVVTVYEAERERWLAERNSARVSRVEELIAGEPVDVDTSEAVIGYRLRVHHLGAVLWVHETGAQQDQVSRFTRSAAAIALHLGSQRTPLLIPRDRASSWAWFCVAEDARPDLGAIRTLLGEVGGPPVPMVAFGRPRPGVAGFRQTHLDACQVQRLAVVRDDPSHPVSSFDEPGLSVAALLARDISATGAWVRETLADLALDDEQHERLRTTLLLFFRNDSSYTATAEQMVMHKNTVKYRLSSAEKALGRSISTDRLAIELALVACHWLGRIVLRTS